MKAKRPASLETPAATVVRKRIGMVTPSSNTVLEPVSATMVASLPEVSLHFARFRVTEISLSDEALGQFASDGMLAAARLLADARVDAICWNGTSGSWLGLDRDRALCALIKQETGTPATSAVLAMVDALRAAGLGRIGLVTPYVDRVQRRIAATLAAEGFDLVAEQHLDLSENFAFSQVCPAQLEAMMREVAAARPQAILVLCTNLRAAPLSDRMERETGIPVLDSTATALLGGLNLVGVDSARLRGWGMLFGGLPRVRG